MASLKGKSVGAMRPRGDVARRYLIAAMLVTLSREIVVAGPLRPHPPAAPPSPPAATSPSQKFVQTLSAVVQRPGTATAANVSAPAGRITKWFVPATPASAGSPVARAAAAAAAAPAGSSPPPVGSGSTGANGPPSSSVPGDSSTSGDSSPWNPAPWPSPQPDVSTASDPNATGAPTEDPYAMYGQPNNASASPSSSSSGLYAGMAYEVWALERDGSSNPVDPSTRPFHTGDRFVVYYRPSMPGRVDVFNISPRGQQIAIDATNVPGGQLVTLGPYEFTDSTGDEALSLVLTPCGGSALMAATRDIVKLNGVAPGAPGLPLPSCGDPGTRGLRAHTRDIRKMQVDAGTSYALDPVSQQELASGQYDARQVTITFHHQ